MRQQSRQIAVRIFVTAKGRLHAVFGIRPAQVWPKLAASGNHLPGHWISTLIPSGPVTKNWATSVPGRRDSR